MGLTTITLAQIPTSETFWLKALDSGVSWVIVLAAASTFIALAAWAIRRTFGKDGLLAEWIESNRVFIDRLANTADRHAESSEKTGRAVRKVAATSAASVAIATENDRKLSGLTSDSTRMLSMAHAGCDALRKIAAALNVNIDQETGRIESLIEERAKTVSPQA